MSMKQMNTCAHCDMLIFIDQRGAWSTSLLSKSGTVCIPRGKENEQWQGHEPK